jgi:thiol-disulfide isomerase/thioredoxin
MKTWLILAMLALALPASAAGVDELHPFVRGSWKEIRAAHAGRPTVVHFWGLTCGPCRVEMPLLGRFLQQRPDLNLVMIDADFAPNDPTEVATTLVQTGLAGVENWIFSDDFAERLRYEIDPKWQGDIPRTLLIAADGTVTTVEGVADVEKLRARLDRQGMQR